MESRVSQPAVTASRAPRPRATLAGLLLLAATASAAAPPPPRLAVIVAIDQFPQRHLDRVLPYLPEGGFRRLLAEGAVFADAHHDQAATYTGPGHAVMVTGAYGARNGVVGNRMYLEAKGRSVDPVRDAGTALVEGEGYGASPWVLEADTLGDALERATDDRAKVVAVGLKDRAAVLLAGRRGLAVWFDDSIGRFVTSSYYAGRAPAWLRELNARHLPEADFGRWWERRGPEEAYAEARADDYFWEGDWQGLTKSFPRRLLGKDFKITASYYKAWSTSAFGLWGELEAVEAALETEQLGADEVPDLLGVSLNSVDYAGHQFGPESHEVISMTFETDAVLKALLELLDDRVGPGRYVLALTSDHGAGAIPEFMNEQGESAGRLRIRRLRKAIDRALSRRYGGGRWVVATEAPFVTLNQRLIRRHGLQRREVESAAAGALSGIDGIEAVFTRTQLEDPERGDDDLLQRVAASFHPERSGDLVVVTARYWIWGKYGERPVGATHGSPWEYDTHVPLVFFGAGVPPTRHGERVGVADLAPTLAGLLGIPAPRDAAGRALSLAAAG